MSPARINIFYHYPGRTGCISQPLASQFFLLAARLSLAILQETYDASYGRFRPNKSGRHSERRDYRGGWHRSCPLLIRHTFYVWQKFPLKREHSNSLCHPFGHCRSFAPAAPRRARVCVSGPFWGLPLTRPLPITGLVVRYTTNYLIGRSPPL